MKKKLIRSLLLAAAVWAIVTVTDFTLVYSCRKPVFCVGVDLADDGGSGRYVGLGYSFELRGNFLPDSENPGVTQYRACLFGVEVDRNYMDATAEP